MEVRSEPEAPWKWTQDSLLSEGKRESSGFLFASLAVFFIFLFVNFCVPSLGRFKIGLGVLCPTHFGFLSVMLIVVSAVVRRRPHNLRDVAVMRISGCSRKKTQSSQ